MNCVRCNKEIIKRRGNVRYCLECKLLVEKEWKLRIHKKWYAKFRYSPKYFEQLEKKKIQKNKERARLREENPRFCEICNSKLPYKAKKWCNNCKKIGLKLLNKKWVNEHKKRYLEYANNFSKEWRGKQPKEKMFLIGFKTRLKRLNLTLEEYFKMKEEGCLICGFKETIDIHHKNENITDNRKENLIVLCPNHHQLLHRTNKTLEDLIKEFKL